MRPRTVLVAAPALALAALAALAGCGSAAKPTAPATSGVSIHVSVEQGFAARAAQVAAAWPGSVQEQAWRTGYYPLNDPTVLPTDAFHSSADKAAFLAGRFTVRLPLPTLPPRTRVRFDSGVSLELPSLDPLKALREAGSGVCPATRCDTTLTVTSAEPTTLRVPTSRGEATVPAWSFRLAGYHGPLVVPAVRSGAAAFDVSGVRPEGVSERVLGAQLVSVSADGRTLTLSVGHGSCGNPGDATVGGSVYESAGSVVVGGWAIQKPLPSGTVCGGVVTSSSTTVHLSRPLGGRAVLNVIDGSPERPTA
jgi:hypothetical protein